MAVAKTVRHLSRIGSALLFSFFFTLLVLPVEPAAATTWEPEPAPKALTQQQRLYYPSLDTYTTPRVRDPLLLVLTRDLSWQKMTPQFEKYPQLKKYASAGAVGTLNTSGCLSESVLTIQNGYPTHLARPCPRAAVAAGKIAGIDASYWQETQQASPGQLAGVLEAFGIKTRAIGSQAGLLLADGNGSVKNYAALPESVPELTAKVKAGISEGGLTVVDLSTLSSAERQLQMLEGALAGLSPKSGLISLSLVADAKNTAPYLLSYSPASGTGLATSASTNAAGLSTLADTNAQILSHFSLPVPEGNRGRALSAHSLPGQSQSLINLDNTASSSAEKDLQQRLDYLQNQVQLSTVNLDVKIWLYLAITCCLFLSFGGYLGSRKRGQLKRRRIRIPLSAAAVFAAFLSPASFCLYYLLGADWAVSPAWAGGAIALVASLFTALLALLVSALRQSFAFSPAQLARGAGIATSVFTLGIILWTRKQAEYTQVGTPLGYSVLDGPFLWQLSAEAAALTLSCILLAVVCALASLPPIDTFWRRNRVKCRAITAVTALALFTGLWLWAGVSALICAVLFLAPLAVAFLTYASPLVASPCASRSSSHFRAVSVVAVLGALSLGCAGILGTFGVSPDAPATKIDALSQSADTKVAVVFTSGLSWEDLVAAQPELAHRSSAVRSGALFTLAPYPFKAMACPQDAWLTFSAGRPLSRYSLAGRNLCLEPEPLSDGKRVQMWDYYQRSAIASSFAAKPGVFAEQLREAQISAGAIGNSAALALADPEGIIRGEVSDIDPLAPGYAQAVQSMVSSHALTLIDVQAGSQNLNPDRLSREVGAQQQDIFYFLDPATGKSQLEKSDIWDPIWLLQNGGSLSGNSLQAGTLVTDSKNARHQLQDRNNLRRSEMNPQINPTPAASVGLFGDSDSTFAPGALHLVDLSTVLSQDPGLDPDYLTQTRKQNHRLFPTVATYPDLRGKLPDRINLTQQEKQITALKHTLAALPENTRALVVSANPDSAQQGLQAAMVYGKGISEGIIYSPSTHQMGIAQTADLPTTVLDWLGARNPKLSTSGSPLMISANAATSADRLERLVSTSQRADASYARLGLPPSKFVAFAAGALLVLVLSLVSLLVIRPNPRRPHLQIQLGMLGQFLCLAVASLPAACLGAAMLPWWEAEAPTSFFTSVSILIATLLALVACTGPWSDRPIGPALVIAAFSTFFICLDVATGSHISMDSPFGSFSLLGARFFGFGNVYYSVCAIWTLLLCGCVTSLGRPAAFRGKRNSRLPVWLANLFIAFLGIAFMVVDGLPRFGADFGGPISFLPGFLVLVLLLNGKRIGIKRMLVVLMVAAGASVGLAFADWMRPAAQRTHLGNFVQSIINGDLQVIITRKLLANLASWGSITYVWSLLCCLLVFVILVLPALSLTPVPTNLFLPDNFAAAPLTPPLRQEESAKKYWQRGRSYLRDVATFATWLFARVRPQLGETPLAKKESTLRITLLAIGINQLFAYLLNDSGTQLPATGLLLTALAYCSALFASLPGTSRGLAR